MSRKVISRDEALKVSPHYVAFVEGDWDAFNKVEKVFEGLKRGQEVITFDKGEFVLAKVTSINHDDFRAVDGPIVRVSDGESSWRVDGSKYAYPNKADAFSVVDSFHAHLDECSQCREHPFNLCAVGQKRLVEVGRVR